MTQTMRVSFPYNNIGDFIVVSRLIPYDQTHPIMLRLGVRLSSTVSSI